MNLKGLYQGAAAHVSTADLDVAPRGWADKIGNVAVQKGGGAPQSPSEEDVPLPDMTVRIDGKTIKMPMLFIEQWQVRHAVNEIPSATIVIRMQPNAPGDNYAVLDHTRQQFAIGAKAELMLAQRTVFSGVVGAVQIRVDAGGVKINVRLKSLLQSLKATPYSRIWKPQQDAALIREMLHERHVRLGDVTLPSAERVQRLQWNCSDWHFLRAILGLQGGWLWPQIDGSVNVRVPSLGGKTHVVSARPGPKKDTLLAAEWGYSGLSLPRTLTTQSWDVAKQTAVSKTAKPRTLGQGGLAPASLKALGAEGRNVVEGLWSGSQQQAAVDSWLMAQHALAVNVRLTLTGCRTYQVGDTVRLEGFGTHLDGAGIVTLIEHSCDVSGRIGKTVVGVGLDDATAASPTLSMPSGLLMGHVMPYQADPQGKAWNRLPVKVPVLGSEAIWARMGHVYASKESGVTFYPEVGDEVALAFVGDMAVIMASLHNPTRKAAIEPDDKHRKKGVVLRHHDQRVELSFDCAHSAATLELGADKKPEQQLVIDKEKGLRLTNLAGHLAVDVKAGGTTVTTKQKMVLTAEEQLTLVGKGKVTVTSDKDVHLDAKENLDGQGKARVQMVCAESGLKLSPEKAALSAGQVSVTGNISVAIKGNETVNVKGADVGLAGDVKVAVSGARVTVDGQAEVSVQSPHTKVGGNMTEVGGGALTQVTGNLINLG